MKRLIELTPHLFDITRDSEYPRWPIKTTAWNCEIMRLSLKILTSALLLGLLLVIGCLLVIQLSPQSLLSMAPYVSPYQVTAEKMAIDLRTPSIDMSGLRVNNDDLEVVTLDNFTFSTSWGSLRSDSQEWVARAKNGVIHLNHLAPSQSPAPSETSAPNIGNLHRILQKADVNVENIRVNISVNAFAELHHLRRPDDLKANEQGLIFSLRYQKNETILPLQGTLLSTVSEDVPQITLSLPTIDMRDVISAQEEKHSQTVNNTSTTANDQALESRIDWSPLSQLTPLNLVFESDKVQIPQGSITNIRSQVTLTDKEGVQGILQEHSANVDLILNNDFAIKRPITLTGDWSILDTITSGADINGNTALVVGNDSLTLKGTMNINGLLDQDISFVAAVDQFPLSTRSEAAKKYKIEIDRLLPLNANTQLRFKKNQLSLNKLSITAKDSDLSGNLHINFDNDKAISLYAITFNLESEKITLPDKKTKNTEAATGQKKDNKGSLFNDEKISVDWLTNIKASGHYNVGKVIRNGTILMSDAKNTITLDNSLLQLNSKIDKIAGGKTEINLSINHENAPLKISANGAANNIILEKLSLLPKEELSGGKTNITFSLESSGDSSKALASKLQGDVLVTATDGIIANNTFELIGSDIFLKLINTINPFYKSAKTTNLECAVIKSKIVDGKMLFDDSIAIKTSKMIIVADGSVDLPSEKINVGINPKAREGVGVDLASLAKFVAVQGSLTKPTVGVSGKGTAKSLLNIGAAISTGGLSLLASKLADSVISGDACDVAQKAFTEKKVDTSPTSAKPSK